MRLPWWTGGASIFDTSGQLRQHIVDHLAAFFDVGPTPVRETPP